MLVLGSVQFSDGSKITAEESKKIRDAIFEAVKKNITIEKQTYAVISWVFEECKEALETKKINL